MTGDDVALRPRLPAALPFALFWVLAVNALQHVHAQAVVTLGNLIAVGFAALVFGSRRITGSTPGRETYNPDRRSLPALLWIFLLYVALRLILQPDPNGTQNAIVWAIFFLGMFATAAQTSASTPKIWLPRLRNASLVAASVYLGTVAIAGLNTSLIYGARPYAMMAAVGICLTVPLINSRPKSAHFEHSLGVSGFYSLLALPVFPVPPRRSHTCAPWLSRFAAPRLRQS